MDLILSFIKDGQLLSYPSEAKKVRVRVARFNVVNDELDKRGFSLPYLKCLILGELYKRGFLLPYLKCLILEEAMYVL